MKKVYVEIPDGKSAKWINGVLTLTDDEVVSRILNELQLWINISMKLISNE